MPELDTVYCGDCAEVMAAWPDECIDLTVTSPPYDKMDGEYNLIPGGLRNYNGYHLNFAQLAQQLYRVTKHGGVVVWVVGDATIDGSETGTSFRQALYFKELGFNLHDTMIYEWHRPPINANRYEQHFEYMFILSKESPKTFNPIKIQSKHAGEKTSMKGISQSNQDGNRLSKNRDKDFRIIGNEKVIGNVWYFPTGKDLPDWERILVSEHPARFSESLARDHILSWSNPGDTVLDPMCGSGTTLKEAKELGRHWLGIDISEKYCELSRRRVDGARVPLPMMSEA